MRRGERGEVSLIAVLVASVLMIVILGATLKLFEGFTAKAGDATRRTEAEDQARTAINRLAQDLRNLASPTAEQPQAVDYSSGSDLIFLTVDPAGPNTGQNTTNTKRVRYCLDASRNLQEQTQTWTSAAIPAVPAHAACPSTTGWTRTRTMAAYVVNGTVPVFSVDSTVLTDISEVHVNLLVDTDIVKLPPATNLSTGVFLRNQNRRPAAAFSAAKTAGGLVLNGSSSVDPEGDTLTYKWYDGTTLVGTGITFTYLGLAVNSVHQIRLDVFDPAGLSSTVTQAATA